MKTLFGFSTVVAFAMAAVACSNDYAEAPSTLEVTGRVDTQLRAHDNATAVALGSDGRTYSSYIQTNGSFRLTLPVGNVYRIIFANSTMSGELRTIGHLVNETSSGKTDEIAVKEGGKLDIGSVRPAGSPSTSTGGVKTACECDTDLGGKGDPDADPTKDGDITKDGDTTKDGSTKVTDSDDKDFSKDDDYATKPKDGDKDRLCDDAMDVELKAEKGPGDKCAKGGSDKSAPKVVKKSCAVDKSDPVDKSDAVDKSGSTDKSSPDSCTCSSQCGSGSACAASKCTSDDGSSGSSSGAKTPTK
jgi:hypothetical protein